MTDASSPFAVLGLPDDASPDAVRKAYRTLALRFHPDRNPGDEAAAEAFHAVREAYEALDPTDPDGGYDAERVVAEMQEAAAEVARRRAGTGDAGRGWQLCRFALAPPSGLGARLARALRREPDPTHAVETHWQGLRDLRGDVLVGWTEIRDVREAPGAVELTVAEAAAARLGAALPEGAVGVPAMYRLALPEAPRLAAIVRRQIAKTNG